MEVDDVANAVHIDRVRRLRVARRAEPARHGRVRVGTVHGDDILPRLPSLLAAGHELRNLDTGAPLADIVDRVVSANVYIGAAPLVALLQQGATVVIAGRSTDTALTYAPIAFEFGWTTSNSVHSPGPSELITTEKLAILNSHVLASTD